LTVVIFEAGVAVHSVIVGVDLGITSGKEFTNLLLALCFHQFTEGVAVGTSATSAFTSVKASVITSVIFSVTTPIGIALGILLSSTYSPTSTAALWLRGTIDALAGGILVYTGIVELLTYQFTTNQEFHSSKGSARAAIYISIWMGSAAMTLIGKWA